MSIFNKIAPNFTYSQKSWFFKYNWNFLDQLLLPYKFQGSDMWGMYFFISASCEPLTFLWTWVMGDMGWKIIYILFWNEVHD